VKALSAFLRIPILIFRTCDNFAGYVCFSALVGRNHMDADIQRRTLPFHIRGDDEFSFLENVMVDNVGEDLFDNTLNSICKFMIAQGPYRESFEDETESRNEDGEGNNQFFSKSLPD
jgi:hypothetical protein